MDADVPVALGQIHVGPVEDSITHEMSAFCPCGPSLDTDPCEPTEEFPEGVPVITYTHNRVAEQE